MLIDVAVDRGAGVTSAPTGQVLVLVTGERGQQPVILVIGQPAVCRPGRRHAPGWPGSVPPARQAVIAFSLALNPSPGAAGAWPSPGGCLAMAADS